MRETISVGPHEIVDVKEPLPGIQTFECRNCNGSATIMEVLRDRIPCIATRKPTGWGAAFGSSRRDILV